MEQINIIKETLPSISEITQSFVNVNDNYCKFVLEYLQANNCTYDDMFKMDDIELTLTSGTYDIPSSLINLKELKLNGGRGVIININGISSLESLTTTDVYGYLNINNTTNLREYYYYGKDCVLNTNLKYTMYSDCNEFGYYGYYMFVKKGLDTHLTFDNFNDLLKRPLLCGYDYLCIFNYLEEITFDSIGGNIKLVNFLYGCDDDKITLCKNYINEMLRYYQIGEFNSLLMSLIAYSYCTDHNNELQILYLVYTLSFCSDKNLLNMLEGYFNALINETDSICATFYGDANFYVWFADTVKRNIKNKGVDEKVLKRIKEFKKIIEDKRSIIYTMSD